ncbi:TonB-dependent receptor [Niabella terrae]
MSINKSIIYSAVLILLAALPFGATAQLKGRVINDNNEALPGASVQIRGTTTGTVSDSLGAFGLDQVPETPFTLAVSSVGYNPRNIVVRKLTDSLYIRLVPLFQVDTVVITSRRRQELLQEVPISVSVISSKKLNEAGAFNVNRVKELIPSLQLYSSNPRNTGVNIRGLGSPYGLTNDGLDPGVGYYVDGVYYARPAAAVFDFVDIERFEVLRGPQGTLFGKNTSAGAVNITTKKPSFIPSGTLETSFGNYGYIQAKATVTGPISQKLAARLSFSGTQRDGVLYNERRLKDVNDINNLGLRAQLLYHLTDRTSVSLAGDFNKQAPNGYAQVVAGVVTTKRAAYRQFDNIISDLNYQLPSRNAFDRVIDHDTPWNSENELGGATLNIDSKIGPGTLTATTAWRYWKWGPSNDRDFTGLEALAKSQNPSEHRSISQEIRYAGQLNDRLSGVLGIYYIGQEVTTDGTEESGKDQWRFSQNSESELWKTPGLFEGYGIHTQSSIRSKSAAVFANIDWELVDHLHVLPGIRLNYDEKQVDYNRQTYGGLETSDPDLLALKNAVYRNQSYATDASERNITYLLTLAYRPSRSVNAFLTYSTSYKPVGVNVSGLPTVDGEAALDLAVIKPEYTRYLEAGIKTNPTNELSLNLSVYNYDIKDYQTNVQSAELGVNRGYLANADRVQVRGAELDASYQAGFHFNFYGALSYTLGKYVKFTNAPLPLEETGNTIDGVQVAYKDISGGRLPGISKWTGTLGGEYTRPAVLFGRPTHFFIATEFFARSEFSSSATPSSVLNVPGYGILNARTGFKAARALSLFVWARNILDKDYYEQLLAAGGNAGHYAGVLGDPRTYGITLSYTFNGKP